MSQKSIQWFLREVPSLVEKGLLSSQSADNLVHYYKNKIDSSSQKKLALIAFAVLGSLLVGSGIILLLAHNWDIFPRFVRTLLAFFPMLSTQGIAAWMVLRSEKGVARREGVALFYALSIGTVIALVGQIYHISSDIAVFWFAWSLLALPIVYFLNASSPAIFYLIAISVWAICEKNQKGSAFLFWFLLAFLIPYFADVLRKDRYGVRSTLLLWAFVLSLLVVIGILSDPVFPIFQVMVYACFFSLLYLIYRFWFSDSSLVWRHPLYLISNCGIYILSLWLSGQSDWNQVERYYDFISPCLRWKYFENLFPFIGMFVVVIFLFVKFAQQRRFKNLWLGSFVFWAWASYLLALFGYPFISSLLFNVYLFTLGMMTLVKGIRSLCMSQVNGGMLVLISLIVVRFFDSEIGFLARGLVFIALGIFFIFVNVWMSRRGRVK